MTALVLAAPAAARGQGTDATLSGTIVDESDAVIGGVTVTLVSAVTGLRRQVTTSADGFFTFPLVQPGRYVLTATRQGFAPAEVPDLVLNVNDRLALTLQLQVAGTSETVTVEAETVRVSASPAVATVVDRQFVENLPLNGRGFQSLFALTPGLVLVRTTGNEPGAFSVNGQRTTSNYLTVDGVSANVGVSLSTTPGQQAAGTMIAGSALGGTNSLVSMDALEEFKIQTSTYAPEFGRTPGAQISVVTRSGTNRFSGSLFEYFRDDALDANDWFANSLGLPKPNLRQHDYGGVLGGPLRRNETFFFFSHEGIRLDEPRVIAREVPSLATRARAVPAMRPFLDAFPVPNGPTGPNGLAQHAASYSDQSSLDATSLRIDQRIGGRGMLFGRVNYAPSHIEQRAYTTGAPASQLLRSDLRATTVTGGGTMTLSSFALLDVRANWTRNTGDNRTWLDDFGGAAPPPESLALPSFVSSDNGLIFLRINVGAIPFISMGKGVSNLQRQANVVGTLSLVSGVHALKLGVDVRRLAPVYGPRQYDLLPTFASLAAAEAGIASTTVAGDVGEREPVFLNYSAFAQDTWQLARRLSLTYGIRWEHNPVPHERHGLEPYTAIGVDDFATASLAPPGTPLWHASAANIAPRAGAAWLIGDAPGRETTVRGGAGVFYDLGTSEAGSVFGSGLPYRLSKTLANAPFPLSDAAAAPPQAIVPPYLLAAFEPELRLPYTVQWNVAIERALGPKQMVTVTYLGAAGRRLIRRIGMTNPNPTLSTLSVYTNGGESDYRALQVQYQRRLSRGLQALASYTLSESLDNSSADVLDSSLTPAPDRLLPASLDRGPSTFDVRHTATGAVTYEVPGPRGRRMLTPLLSDWAIDLIGIARSALPANVVTFRSTAFGSFSLRPDLVPGVPVSLDDPLAPGGRSINPAAFATTTESRQGTLPRNFLRGLPVWQIDMAVRRTVPLPGGPRLQFRIEMFNIFNHPNFDGPNVTLGSNLFGVPTQMLNRGLATAGPGNALSAQYQAGGPRSLQAAIKLLF